LQGGYGYAEIQFGLNGITATELTVANSLYASNVRSPINFSNEAEALPRNRALVEQNRNVGEMAEEVDCRQGFFVKPLQ